MPKTQKSKMLFIKLMLIILVNSSLTILMNSYPFNISSIIIYNIILLILLINLFFFSKKSTSTITRQNIIQRIKQYLYNTNNNKKSRDNKTDILVSNGNFPKNIIQKPKKIKLKRLFNLKKITNDYKLINQDIINSITIHAANHNWNYYDNWNYYLKNLEKKYLENATTLIYNHQISFGNTKNNTNIVTNNIGNFITNKDYLSNYSDRMLQVINKNLINISKEISSLINSMPYTVHHYLPKNRLKIAMKLLNGDLVDIRLSYAPPTTEDKKTNAIKREIYNVCYYLKQITSFLGLNSLTFGMNVIQTVSQLDSEYFFLSSYKDHTDQIVSYVEDDRLEEPDLRDNPEPVR